MVILVIENIDQDMDYLHFDMNVVSHILSYMRYIRLFVFLCVRNCYFLWCFFVFVFCFFEGGGRGGRKAGLP